MRIRLALGLSIGFVAVLVAWFARGHWDSIYDDALIYLRYVKNLRRGCGLRFNCDGPPVEGFTGPLYLALLYAGSFATDQLIDLCQLIGTASLIGAGAIAILLAHRMRPIALPIAAALALGLDPFMKLNAVIGMETALAALLVTLVVYAALVDRPWLLVAAACGSYLVRPEGLLFIVALPVLPRLRHAKYLAPAAGFVIAIAIARYATFGEFVPNTYLAKSGGTTQHAVIGLSYLWDALLDFPLAFAAPLALAIAARRRAVAYVLGVTAVWLLFFLRTGGDLFDYSRLVVPLVPGLTVLALAGIAELVRSRKLVITLAIALAVGGRAAVQHHIANQHANPRVVAWAALGGYLRAHYPHQLVATVPIGAIGYYSNLPILDLVGLTDPVISHAGRGVPAAQLSKLWIGHERHDTEYVLKRQPRVIATTMHRDRAWLGLEDARAGFYADWLLLQEIKAGRAPYHVVDVELAGHDHYLIFERDAGR